MIQKLQEGDLLSVDFMNNLVTTEEIEEYIKQLSAHPTFQHKCNNCGGTIEMDIDNHIFRCPYCGSAYAIGTNQING